MHKSDKLKFQTNFITTALLLSRFASIRIVDLLSIALALTFIFVDLMLGKVKHC